MLLLPADLASGELALDDRYCEKWFDRFWRWSRKVACRGQFDTFAVEFVIRGYNTINPYHLKLPEVFERLCRDENDYWAIKKYSIGLSPRYTNATIPHQLDHIGYVSMRLRSGTVPMADIENVLQAKSACLESARYEEKIISDATYAVAHRDLNKCREKLHSLARLIK